MAVDALENPMRYKRYFMVAIKLKGSEPLQLKAYLIKF